MICCCSLAGTAACRTCANRFDYPSNAVPESAKISTSKLIFSYEPITNVPQEKKVSLNDLLKEAVPMKAQIFCRNCGAPIMIYHNFCSNCGEKNEQHYVDGGIME